MNFALIPAGNEDTASSRIRVFTLQRTLRSLGYAADVGPSPDADILFFQKRVTWESIRLARQAKDQGRTILYDVDDIDEMLWYFVSQRCFFEMLRLADCITTDTNEHRSLLLRKYGVAHTEIIPDTIDYYPSGPARPLFHQGERLRILWFGNCSNISGFENYVSILTSLPHSEVVVATNASAIPVYLAKYPEVTFVPWSLSTFIPLLQSCQISCLMHDATFIDRAKSNNKMITSITWGVPAVVSRTPEYERTAKDAEIESALFSNPLELRAAIEALRPWESRLAYLNKAQPDIWKRYAPTVAAKSFIEIVSKYRTSFQSTGTSSEVITKPTPVNILGSSPLATKADSMVTRAINRMAFDFWRLRFAEDRIGLIKSIAKEIIARMQPTQPRGRTLSVNIATPRDAHRDYSRDWVSNEGIAYRIQTYERQRKGGTRPLVTNPTIQEVRDALRHQSAQSILEVGCGWGRLLEEMAHEFNIEGCDVSTDMLTRCPPTVRAFYLDIATNNYLFLRHNIWRWEVLFTRGVMLYFMEAPSQMAYAMNNMLTLASKRILIWEWPEVCDRMRQFSDSPKFQYHPIEHREE